MTQLFMNIEFRDFILNLPIADPISQKLLYETQRINVHLDGHIDLLVVVCENAFHKVCRFNALAPSLSLTAGRLRFSMRK
jgi:hypothetical protein